MEIRDNAMSCEAKKHGFRQTQDGVVVSFVIHPQEVPQGLTLAALGTRYMLALVEIGDNEEPKAPQQQGKSSGQDRADNGAGSEDGEEAPNPNRRASQSWHEMSPAQQAGILCNEPSFSTFLTENYPSFMRNSNATQCIRDLCDVASRREILLGAPSYEVWSTIVSEYRAWMREPEIVG